MDRKNDRGWQRTFSIIPDSIGARTDQAVDYGGKGLFVIQVDPLGNIQAGCPHVFRPGCILEALIGHHGHINSEQGPGHPGTQLCIGKIGLRLPDIHQVRHLSPTTQVHIPNSLHFLQTGGIHYLVEQSRVIECCQSARRKLPGRKTGTTANSIARSSNKVVESAKYENGVVYFRTTFRWQLPRRISGDLHSHTH